MRFASEMHAFAADWLPDVEPFPPGCAWTPEQGVRALRDCGAGDEPAPAARRGGAAERDPRRARRRRRAPADGRRAGRRLPLRRPGLEPGRRDRRPLRWPSAASACRPSRSAPRARPTCWPRAASPRYWTPSTTRRPTRPRRRFEALPDVVRAIESFDPGARPQRRAELHARPHDRAAREGRAHRRGRRRALRRLRLPARLHRRRTSCTSSSCAASRQLHNLNLQRCDRVTMAHGLEARVPFLDREVIEWAMRVPADAEGRPRRRAGEVAAARGVRRLAARRPAVAREGRVRRRQRRARRRSARRSRRRSPTRSSRPSATPSTPPLRTKQELAYYRILADAPARHPARDRDQPLRPRLSGARRASPRRGRAGAPRRAGRCPARSSTS